MVRDKFAAGVTRLLDGRKLPWLAERTAPEISYQRLWKLTTMNSDLQSEPTLKEAVIIARVFDVPVTELLGDGADGDGLAPASIVGDAGEHGGGAGSPASPVAGSGRDVRATRVSRRPFDFAPHEVEGSGSLMNPESRS